MCKIVYYSHNDSLTVDGVKVDTSRIYEFDEFEFHINNVIFVVVENKEGGWDFWFKSNPDKIYSIEVKRIYLLHFKILYLLESNPIIASESFTIYNEETNRTVVIGINKHLEGYTWWYLPKKEQTFEIETDLDDDFDSVFGKIIGVIHNEN